MLCNRYLANFNHLLNASLRLLYLFDDAKIELFAHTHNIFSIFYHLFNVILTYINIPVVFAHIF